MDAFRRCCALVLLLAGAKALAGADVRTRVLEDLAVLAGDGARDGGPIRLDDARNEAVACAGQAGAAGQANRVAFERQGIDSKIRKGAARATAAGSLGPSTTTPTSPAAR